MTKSAMQKAHTARSVEARKAIKTKTEKLFESRYGMTPIQAINTNWHNPFGIRRK